MRFYDTATQYDSLVHQAWKLTAKDLVTFPLIEAAMYANMWVGIVTGWIYEAEGGWEADDPNYTDFPIVTENLVDQQQDYQIPGSSSTATPTTILKLISVSVKTAAGLWQKLNPINWSEVPLDVVDRAEYKKTPGMPDSYDAVGNSVFLYCPPASASVTLTAGLKFYLSRAPNLFTDTSTTAQPPFVSIYHNAIAYGMAYEFALRADLDIRYELFDRLMGKMTRAGTLPSFKSMIQTYYAQRHADKRARLTTNRRERRVYR